MFDSTKVGRIEKEKVRTILNTLGHTFDDQELEVLLEKEDEDGTWMIYDFFVECKKCTLRIIYILYFEMGSLCIIKYFDSLCLSR